MLNILLFLIFPSRVYRLKKLEHCKCDITSVHQDLYSRTIGLRLNMHG